MNQIHLTSQEYKNFLDYIATIREIRRDETMIRILDSMGIRRDGIGANKYLIVDKQKWMLAKIKHGF
jgi:hypothetical protein